MLTDSSRISKRLVQRVCNYHGLFGAGSRSSNRGKPYKR